VSVPCEEQPGTNRPRRVAGYPADDPARVMVLRDATAARRAISKGRGRRGETAKIQQARSMSDGEYRASGRADRPCNDGGCAAGPASPVGALWRERDQVRNRRDACAPAVFRRMCGNRARCPGRDGRAAEGRGTARPRRAASAVTAPAQGRPGSRGPRRHVRPKSGVVSSGQRPIAGKSVRAARGSSRTWRAGDGVSTCRPIPATQIGAMLRETTVATRSSFVAGFASRRRPRQFTVTLVIRNSDHYVVAALRRQAGLKKRVGQRRARWSCVS